MKKAIFSLFIIMSFFLMTNVSAKADFYFVNDNGVQLNKIEYNNILQIHGLEMLNNLTQDMLNEYKDFYNDPNIIINTNYNTQDIISSYSSFLETNYKELKITSVTSQSATKMIVITVNWKSAPKVKSYDVIGFRLHNTSLKSSVITMTSINGSSQSIAGDKKFSNGYGSSIKLPSNSSSITIQQTFKVSSGGTVYASYQHSVKNISLSNSLNFSISSNGLGNVFKFGDNDLFDQMSGVSINI